MNRKASVGENYFRVHPKGVGVICNKEEGIPAFTFVDEYFGVIHSPWRWYEVQDMLRKQHSNSLTDFYNIILERPIDDPYGYDAIFIDAASRGSITSRMSHSCDPNCNAIVLSHNGKLAIAMYTMKDIRKGEELTFDYSSVTEDEKEYRSATCLCGTHLCRGSYLFYSESNAFMQLMNKEHNYIQRNTILLRACLEPLDQSNISILKVFLVILILC